MKIIRIVGAESNILKVHHTKYLMIMGLQLADAKHLTDDILDGKAREVPVSGDLAEIHAQTLRILGAKVEVEDRLDIPSATVNSRPATAL